MELFESFRTVLRHPTWYSDTVIEENFLPLAVDAYTVTSPVESNRRWIIKSGQGETVYNGIGPVTVSEG